LVKKYGVQGAAKRRKSAKRAAAKRKRARSTAKRNPAKKRVRRSSKRRAKPMAKRRRKSTRRKRKSYAKNPRKRKTARRRRTYRKNAWKGQPRKHSRAAKLGWARRRRRKTTKSRKRRRPTRRKRYSVRKYYKRRGKVKGTRKQVRARRRNIRKALNKRYGVRKWRKHSTAKWNPGTSLSLAGFTRSMTKTFSIEMLKDGVAIAGGIVGALSLPGLVQNILPTAIRSRVSLTSGWTGYLANFAAAGIVGYLAGLAFGVTRGRQVLYGGLGAAMAKLLLDKVPLLSAKTGVTLGGNSELDRLVEQEIAAELASGSDMGAYVGPSQVAQAAQLGDYVGPAQVAQSDSLGLYSTEYPEFGNWDSGVAEFPV
jgi:hypothetical protein